MPSRVKEKCDNREFSSKEKMFVCKLLGKNFPKFAIFSLISSKRFPHPGLGWRRWWPFSRISSLSMSWGRAGQAEKWQWGPLRTLHRWGDLLRGQQQELLEFLVLLPRDMIRILRNHLSTQSPEKTQTWTLTKSYCSIKWLTSKPQHGWGWEGCWQENQTHGHWACVQQAEHCVLLPLWSWYTRSVGVSGLTVPGEGRPHGGRGRGTGWGEKALNFKS